VVLFAISLGQVVLFAKNSAQAAKLGRYAAMEAVV
jgi:hypothetical protein